MYQKVGGFGGENYNPNHDSPSKINNINDLTKDNIYLRGGNSMAEALLKTQNQGIPNGGSIAMRMKKNKDSSFKTSMPVQGVNL